MNLLTALIWLYSQPKGVRIERAIISRAAVPLFCVTGYGNPFLYGNARRLLPIILSGRRLYGLGMTMKAEMVFSLEPTVGESAYFPAFQ